MICIEVVSTVTGDPERGGGEMVRTEGTDTPPVEEGGDQVKVSREELTPSCCVDTIGVSGGDGAPVRE